MISSVNLTATLLRTNSVIENTAEPLAEYQSTYRAPSDPGGSIDGIPVNLINDIYLATLNYQEFLYMARKKLKEIEDANTAEGDNNEQMGRNEENA